jgi:hypothetical protein
LKNSPFGFDWNWELFFRKYYMKNKSFSLALMGAASPDLEKQGFLP